MVAVSPHAPSPDTGTLPEAIGGGATVTSEVALAMIDALALWAHPVTDSLEARSIVPVDQEKKTLSDSDSSKNNTSLKKDSPEQTKHPLSAQRQMSHQQPESNRSFERPLSPLACFSKTLKEQQQKQTSLPSETKVPLSTREQKETTKPTPPQREQQVSSQTRDGATTRHREEGTSNKESVSQTEATEGKLVHKDPTVLREGISQHSHDPLSKDQERDHSPHYEEHPKEGKSKTSVATTQKVDQVARVRLQKEPQPQKNDPLMEWMGQEATELSAIFGCRVSHFDVLLIFIELMKLEIQGQEDDKISRRVERQMQLNYLEQEVANYKSQSKMLLFANIGGGVLGIVSGAAPIIGFMKGDSILGSLSTVFTSLQGANKKDFFDGISKMTYAMSETQKSIGQIYGAKAEGDRTRYNRYSDLHKVDHEEVTRNIEQLQERFRQSERFLSELLQMRHDVTSQLYR